MGLYGFSCSGLAGFGAESFSSSPSPHTLNPKPYHPKAKPLFGARTDGLGCGVWECFTACSLLGLVAWRCIYEALTTAQTGKESLDFFGCQGVEF